MKEDTALLKATKKDDRINELKTRTKEHDYENILKSPKNENDFHRKKCKCSNVENLLLVFFWNFLGSSSTILSSALSTINPYIAIPIVRSSALKTSLANLIKDDQNSKQKVRHTKLNDRINVITLLNEKTLKQTMLDKGIGEKEAIEFEKIFNVYLDKRSDKMKSTQSNVEVVFSDILGK